MNSEQFSSWLKQTLYPSVPFAKPLVMGIVNVTPDSFSDGGRFLSRDDACAHALSLIEQGADLIDIGGESSKPGAHQVPLDVELERVIPVIELIRKHSNICISVDTNKAQVMVAAVQAGANVINDICALTQPGALEAAAKLAVPVCLMHMRGQPLTMQSNPNYSQGLCKEIVQFFSDRITACNQAGIPNHLLVLDPGFGFGKNVHHNLDLIFNLKEFKQFNLPLLLGVSRKDTIGKLLKKEVANRLTGSITLAVYAVLKGVGILRTHDVDETNQALLIIEAINQRG